MLKKAAESNNKLKRWFKNCEILLLSNNVDPWFSLYIIGDHGKEGGYTLHGFVKVIKAFVPNILCPVIVCLFLYVIIKGITYCFVTKTRLFKYIQNFTSKIWKFSDKKLWYFFHISAQNIDCWYSLEPPRRGGSNKYRQSMFSSKNKKNNINPCKPSFTLYKSGI